MIFDMSMKLVLDTFMTVIPWLVLIQLLSMIFVLVLEKKPVTLYAKINVFRLDNIGVWSMNVKLKTLKLYHCKTRTSAIMDGDGTFILYVLKLQNFVISWQILLPWIKKGHWTMNVMFFLRSMSLELNRLFFLIIL